ncbi:MAG: hypothetical protein LBB14_03690 [Puniceicoccales bacterium]|nr:hypothetical protein [Puniceicoccales bacterium]
MPKSPVRKFLQELLVTYPNDRDTPTVPVVLEFVKTKTEHFTAQDRVKFLTQVAHDLCLARDFFCETQFVLALTIVALVEEQIYDYDAIIRTYAQCSGTEVREVRPPTDGALSRVVKGPYHSPVEILQILAAYLFGEYFLLSGAPHNPYVNVVPACFDGRFAVSMEKITNGIQAIDLFFPIISKDRLCEMLDFICAQVREGKNYLAVANPDELMARIVIPASPQALFGGQKYGSDDEFIVYNILGGEGKKFSTSKDLKNEGNRWEFSRQLVSLNNRYKNKHFRFLFRPFLCENFIVFSIFCVDGSTYRMQAIPFLPSERGGELVRQSIWLKLLDLIVGYWDRQNPNNTFLLEDGSFRSIDLDGCCGTRCRLPRMPSVVDVEMEQVMMNLDRNSIAAIFFFSGLSEEMTAVALERIELVRTYIRKLRRDEMVIPVSEWPKQRGAALAGTLATEIFACWLSGGDISTVLWDLYGQRRMLAPSAGEETEAERCVREMLEAVRSEQCVR